MVRQSLKWWASALVAACVSLSTLAAPSCLPDTSALGLSKCTLSLPCTTCISRPGIKVRAVVHGTMSDLFWLRVRRGMETAAKHLQVDFKLDLQIRSSNAEMAKNIQSVMEEDSPDVMIVTLPAEVVKEAALEASKRAIVFVLNAGLTTWQGAGAKAYFGQDERLAGEQALGQFQKAAAKRGVAIKACVAMNHGPGAGWSVPRVEGFKAKCNEAGLAWLGDDDYGVTVDEARVDATQSIGENTMEEFKTKYPDATDGLAMLGLGFGTSAGLRAAWRKDKDPRVLFGHFDVDTEGIAAGEVIFTIDQNEWLQGYYPVLLSVLYVTTGNLMAPSVYPTGPAFVTSVPSAEESLAQSEAFPVCDCPWFGGYEDLVPCSPSVESAIAPCPKATACESPCIDARKYKIVGVTHAHEADTFWFTVKAGAEQAANDLRLVDFKMDLFAPPDSGRPDAFSEENFEKTLAEVSDMQDVDGIFASIHGSYIEDEITYAASKKYFVTINSGSDVSESLNPPDGKLIAHVGMDEYLAGELAGKRLSDAGVEHLAILQFDKGNSALVQRQSGATKSMEAAGGKVTIIDLEAASIGATDDNAISSHIEQTLKADSTIDGLLTVGGAFVSAALYGLQNAGRSKADFKAGSFDTSNILLEAISNGEYFIFAIDQQAYMQGYMAVSALVVKMLTRQQFAFHTIPSGPFFVEAADPIKGQCLAQAWQPEIVGEGRMPKIDPQTTVAFPVCEIAGSCAEGNVFDITILKCRQCPAGTYRNLSMMECGPCPEGTSTDGETGSAQCRPCPIGAFADKAGMSFCETCDFGSFASSRGSLVCTSCSTVSDQPLTTKFRGSNNAEECVCEPGYYQPSNASELNCITCTDGMECTTGASEPKQLANFYVQRIGSHNARRLAANHIGWEAYRCMGRMCLAGPPGSCAAGRTGLACAVCQENHWPSGAVCEECISGDVVPIILSILGFLVVVCGLFFFVGTDVSKQNFTLLTLASTAGQTVNTVQLLGSLSNLQLNWTSPVKELLGAFSWMSIDLDSLKLQCVVRSDDALAKYVMTLLAIPLWLAGTTVTFFIMRFVTRKNVSNDDLLNSLGLLVVLGFLPITLICFKPLHCVENPNGTSSVATMPQILCWEGSHIGMIPLVVLGILAYPVFIICGTGLVTWLYPRLIAAGGGSSLIRRFRFLYQRFKPSHYYYGLIYLLRSVAISLPPVIFQNSQYMVVFALAFVIMSFTLSQAVLWPWRTEVCNFLDLCLNFCIVLTLVGAAAVVDVGIDELEANLAVFMSICFVLMSVAILVALVFAAKKLLRGKVKPFQIFLSHHKGGAAKMARLVKCIVQGRSSAKLWLDSDELDNLDNIFELVRSDCENVVVLLTEDTLRRRWCAGEMVVAYKNNVPLIPMAGPEYHGIQEKQIENVPCFWTAEELEPLTVAGIRVEDIQATYRHLASLPMISWPQKISNYEDKNKLEEAVMEMMKRCNITINWSPIAAARTSGGSPSGSATSFAILANSADHEATAAAMVLSQMISQEKHWHTEVYFKDSEVKEVANTPLGVGVMLSRGCLDSTAWASVVITAGRVWEGTEMVSVLGDTSFLFPGKEELESTIVPPVAKLLGEPVSAVMKSYGKVLNILSMPFLADQGIFLMKTQCSMVCHRLDSVATKQAAERKTKKSPWRFKQLMQSSLGDISAEQSMQNATRLQAVKVFDEEEVEVVQATAPPVGEAAAPAKELPPNLVAEEPLLNEDF